jgi:hypothetical protein
LRADWPGKKELMQRLVREWNRYPLERIVENNGIAIGFGVKHSCNVWFKGSPKEFYEITIEPSRKDRGRVNLRISSAASLPGGMRLPTSRVCKRLSRRQLPESRRSRGAMTSSPA